MDIPELYAIAAGGLLILCFLVNCPPYLTRLGTSVSSFTARHFTHPFILNRHKFLGPWTRAGLVVQLLYVIANLFCLSFRASTVAEAGLRAGTLSLINMIPLFAGPHHSFVADLLGISLRAYRRFHRAVGLVTGALALFHLGVAQVGLNWHTLVTGRHLYELLAGSSLCLMLLLCVPICRKLSYEIFLRTHQVLAMLFLYATWRHLPGDGLFPRFYLYCSAGLFLTISLVESVNVLYRNGILRYGHCHAFLTPSRGAIQMQIRLSKPMKVEAGQYINLWIPSVSFWAWLQTHPFTVISWAEDKQDTLELFVAPRKGLTHKFLRHAEPDAGKISRLVLFSGPHGMSVEVGDYDNVLMIAGDSGILACLPFLKRLIHGYNARQVRTRRIHLIWQLRDIESGIAAQSLLNDALNDDRVDESYILHISIYLESGNIQNVSFGRRAAIYDGPANIQEILRTEVREPVNPLKDMERSPANLIPKDVGKALVLVSGTDQQRDSVRILTKNYLEDEVKMLELEYQPPGR